MKRVAGPNGSLAEVDTPSGRRYKRQRDGTFHMSDRAAKALVKDGGFFVPDMGVATNRHEGYRCQGCGFGSWFKKCSKCGSDCIKEG